MYSGCLAVAGSRLPHAAAIRLAVCSELRGDAAATRAGPGSRAAEWLRGAGPSAVALVGLAAVAAEPELLAPLPLDGIYPAFASIADASYRAVLPVHLLVLQAGAAAEAEAIVQALTAESVIGPQRVLAGHGLAALAAAERVRLRGK